MPPRFRGTPAIRDVLAAVINAPPDAPAWGLNICNTTGRGPGTVYPALDRLMKAGWIQDHRETPPPAGRPPRRFYAITAAGQAAYENAGEKTPDPRGVTRSWRPMSRHHLRP